MERVFHDSSFTGTFDSTATFIRIPRWSDRFSRSDLYGDCIYSDCQRGKNTDSLSINELWFLGHDHYLGYIYSDSLLGNTTNITRNDSFALLVISRASTGGFMAMPQIGLQSYVMQHVTEEQQRSQKWQCMVR